MIATPAATTPATRGMTHLSVTMNSGASLRKSQWMSPYAMTAVSARASPEAIPIMCATLPIVSWSRAALRDLLTSADSICSFCGRYDEILEGAGDLLEGAFAAIFLNPLPVNSTCILALLRKEQRSEEHTSELQSLAY